MRVEDVCKFQIYKQGENNNMIADPLGIPGQCPVGTGSSPVEAKYDCLVRLLESDTYRSILIRMLEAK